MGYLDDKINSLSKETKQEIMNLLMGEEHLNVGQICKRLGLETGVVAGVIINQIQTIKFLKREVE